MDENKVAWHMEKREDVPCVATVERHGGWNERLGVVLVIKYRVDAQGSLRGIITTEKEYLEKLPTIKKNLSHLSCPRGNYKCLHDIQHYNTHYSLKFCYEEGTLD